MVTTAQPVPAGLSVETSLAELAEASFDRFGDRPSLWFEGRWWHTGELRARAMSWAGGLRDDLAVRPGDRVIVMLPNTPEVSIAYEASWRIGAVVTPVVFLLAGAELAHVIRDSGAVVVITSTEFLTTVLAASQGSQVRSVVVVGGGELGPAGNAHPHLVPSSELDAASPHQVIEHRIGSDLAALLYTGGTTGRAKGVMLSHSGLVAVGVGGATVSHVPAANRSILPLPLSHAYGLLLTCIGLASIDPPESVLMRWFDPATFLRLAQEHRPQRAAVVPSMLAMLLAQPLEDYDLSSLRFISSGGAPLAPEVQSAIEARLPGVILYEGYGLTETSGLCTTSAPADRRRGTVGRAAPGYEVRIADAETDEVLAAGAAGEVQVHGPGVMAGYWHDDEATARTLRGGWLHTGDVGILDDDGYLRVVDRLKDLIIRGGFNIYPRDVEDTLMEHPDVVQAAVVGRPDAVYGEEVVGFVSLRDGATVTGEELVGWARSRVAAHKYPREVRVIPAVPLTSIGKLDRKKLRVLAQE